MIVSSSRVPTPNAHTCTYLLLLHSLPISQISELLGPDEGKDNTSAATICHGYSYRQPFSGFPSISITHLFMTMFQNPQTATYLNNDHPSHHLLPFSLIPHHSSFCLIILDILPSAGLLDVLLELKRQSQAMQSHDPKSLRHSLAFIVESPETLQSSHRLRRDRSSEL